MSLQLKNNSKSPIAILDLPLIEPGKSIPVTEAKMKTVGENKIHQAWIDKGVLEVVKGKAKVATKAKTEEAEAEDEKPSKK